MFKTLNQAHFFSFNLHFVQLVKLNSYFHSELVFKPPLTIWEMSFVFGKKSPMNLEEDTKIKVENQNKGINESTFMDNSDSSDTELGTDATMKKEAMDEGKDEVKLMETNDNDTEMKDKKSINNKKKQQKNSIRGL